jgi:hypothetical protein
MNKLAITNIIAKRESLSIDNDKEYDYLTLYNQDDMILARSDKYHPQSPIELEYEGLIFLSPAGRMFKDRGEIDISILFVSLKKVIGL